MRRAFGVDFAAAADIESADVGALAAEVMAFDDRACFDIQHRVAHHKHAAVESVNVRPIPAVDSSEDLIGSNVSCLGCSREDKTGAENSHSEKLHFLRHNNIPGLLVN
jgi:hypothetical protein